MPEEKKSFRLKNQTIDEIQNIVGSSDKDIPDWLINADDKYNYTSNSMIRISKASFSKLMEVANELGVDIPAEFYKKATTPSAKKIQSINAKIKAAEQTVSTLQSTIAQVPPEVADTIKASDAYTNAINIYESVKAEKKSIESDVERKDELSNDGFCALLNRVLDAALEEDTDPEEESKILNFANAYTKLSDTVKKAVVE